MKEELVAEEEASSEDTSYMQSGDDETTEGEDASLKTCPGQVSSNSASAATEPMKGKHDLEETFDSTCRGRASPTLTETFANRSQARAGIERLLRPLPSASADPRPGPVMKRPAAAADVICEVCGASRPRSPPSPPAQPQLIPIMLTATGGGHYTFRVPKGCPPGTKFLCKKFAAGKPLQLTLPSAKRGQVESGHIMVWGSTRQAHITWELATSSQD